MTFTVSGPAAFSFFTEPPQAGQYYTEYSKDGALFRLWLEDEWSLLRKGMVIRERGMGGVAAWKLGDEATGTWELLENALEGEIPAFPEDQNVIEVYPEELNTESQDTGNGVLEK